MWSLAILQRSYPREMIRDVDCEIHMGALTAELLIKVKRFFVSKMGNR